MKLPAVFNATMDTVIGWPVWVWKLAALAVAFLIALAVIRSHDDGLRETGRDEIRDSVAEHTALRLHRQKDSIGKGVDRQAVVVTHTIHRLDTLWKQLPESIVTRADTVKVLESLPALRISTDSAIRACSDYQTWFAKYRTACDSLDIARQQEVAGLKRQLAAVKPSKYQTVLRWGERIIIAGVAFKLGHASK